MLRPEPKHLVPAYARGPRPRFFLRQNDTSWARRSNPNPFALRTLNSPLALCAGRGAEGSTGKSRYRASAPADMYRKGGRRRDRAGRAARCNRRRPCSRRRQPRSRSRRPSCCPTSRRSRTHTPARDSDCTDRSPSYTRHRRRQCKPLRARSNRRRTPRPHIHKKWAVRECTVGPAGNRSCRSTARSSTHPRCSLAPAPPGCLRKTPTRPGRTRTSPGRSPVPLRSMSCRT